MAFIDQSEFEAMKTLSGWEAARCGEHPFRGRALELFSSDRCLTKWSEQRKNNKNGTFVTAHFLYLTVCRVAFGHLNESC